MEKYEIRKWKDPILREVCTPVENFFELGDIVESMQKIVGEHAALGLAAPQIGDSRQIVVARVNKNIEVFINPIIKHSGGYIPFIEGCLSFPGKIIPTIRRYSINLEYQNRDGVKINRDYKGINAVILQHEIDHLSGKLIISL
jgi:peptide deformylase